MNRRRIPLCKTALAALVIASLATMTGCGGGGGSAAQTPLDSSSAPSGASPTITTPGSSSSGTVSSGTATSFADARALYVSGNEALDWINAQRDGCGSGSLASDSALQSIAGNHSNYLMLNGLGPSHPETEGKPGFTGTRIGERATAAGYAWSLAIEGIAAYSASDLVGARTLMSLPYHRLAMLDHRLNDLGIAAARSTSGLNAGLGLTVVAAGVKSTDKPQALKASAQGACTYPADGSSGVALIAQSEYPNPVPELGAWGSGAYPGYPVSIQIPANAVLTVSSFQLTEPSGRSVPVKVIDRTDTIKMAADGIKHWAFAVPLEPLKPSTRYTVTFTGLNDDKPLARTWYFTTRADAVSVESVTTQPALAGSTGGALIRLSSPGDYLNMGSMQASAACGSGYSFSASMSNVEITVRHTAAAPAAGCSFSFNVIEPVSRKEYQLTATLP